MIHQSVDPNYIKDDFLEYTIIEYFTKLINGTKSLAKKIFEHSNLNIFIFYTHIYLITLNYKKYT